MGSVAEAIILSGGLGTRLSSVTKNEIPKGMVQVQGKPILEWILLHLSQHNINHAVFALGHQSSKIVEHFGDSYSYTGGTIDIGYSIEKTKLGSGGATKLAARLVSGDALVINGDILTNTNLTQFIENHHKIGKDASMLTTFMKSPYGIVKGSENIITSFDEKPVTDLMIHAGIDLINHEMFRKFPDKGQMEDTIFRYLADKRNFAYFLIPRNDFWKSIDTEKDLLYAEENWGG